MRAATICGLLALTTAFLAAPRADAAGLGTFTYEWALPTGDTQEFIENDSWFGAKLSWKQFKRSDLSWSFSFGFNEFHETSGELIQSGNLTLSGDQYRNIQVWPFLVGGQKWFGNRRENRTYLGLSLGTTYASQLLDIGLYSEERNNWHFTLVPELGVVMPAILRDQGFALLTVSYTYNVGAGDYLGGDSRSWSYLAIALGFAWERY